MARLGRRDPLGIAVVGLGYWGPNLVRNIAEADATKLVALCDSSSEALEGVARRYPSARTTQRFEEVLASGDVDAVVIATPISSHASLAHQALEAGKHVFVEKPLASSVAEAAALAELAETRGLVLMPGHTFLYSPPVQKIKEIIDSGDLGEIYFISTSRVNLGLHQPDVSVVWDLGPHDVSILRYWLGELPSDVSALSRSCVLPGVPDIAFINLRFPSGAVAHVELSWLAPSKLRRTAIVGSHKMVVYDDTSNESVRIFDSGANLPDPETFGEYRLSYRTGDIVSPAIDPTEPLSLELADFVAAIREGRPLTSSPAVGIDVVRTLEAVDRSLAAGGAPAAVEGSRTPPDIAEQLTQRLQQAAGSEDAPSDTAGSSEPTIGTAVLGGGPAGLTAAYVLALRGKPGVVFEADGIVGGIAKTVEFKGYRFDLGGHRFFTKLKPIERLWEAIMGDEFLTRPRLSRIFYDGKFFSYPLTVKDIFGRLGLWESTLCGLSYLRETGRRRVPVDTFEEWVTTRFGRRLYDLFFRSYTEKVWGVPGSEIRSQWAAQRIKNFSLGQAVLTMVGMRRQQVTTLIEEFRYPRLGPGQMWERLAKKLERGGIPVRLSERCTKVRHENGRVTSMTTRRNGDEYEHLVDGVLTSLALRDLVGMIDPAPPARVLEAAKRLRYRDLVVVALITTEKEPFPDNWIYLHDPATRAGRVQNYGAWSDAMVQPGTTCLGVEYFCFEGDDIWQMRDDEAVEFAKNELARIGLIDPSKVFDGVKVRVPKAYPMYDAHFEEAVAVVREYLDQFENLKTFGRNGLHRYNNQDHSMATAILATLNLVDGSEHDVWGVNVEDEYLEEGEIVESLLGREPAPATEDGGAALPV
jgi:predicted dehydrogenase/protoporphyrinogen oxidase